MTTIQLLSTQPWVERLGWTLIHFVWQGACIAAIYALACRFPQSAGARYLLGCAALAGMAAPPWVTFEFLAPLSPGHIASATPIAAGYPIPAIESYLRPPGFWQRAVPYLVVVWLIGVVAFSMRLLGGWFIATRLRTSAAHLAQPEWQRTLEKLARSIGVARPVQLLVSTAVDVPAVIGWMKPAILIPAGALAGISPDYLEALLTHELAHIRRHDFLFNMLQNVIETVLFYHPAVWWVSKQIRVDRELCCDDLAVAASGDVLTYARALAELEVLRAPHPRVALAAAGGSLRNRIRRLLAPPERTPSMFSGFGAASLAILILFSAGLWTLGHAQDPQPAAGPFVNRDAIWIDAVKQGEMPLSVRVSGILKTRNLMQLMLPQAQMQYLKPGAVVFDPGNGVYIGTIARIDPHISNGMFAVDVEMTTVREDLPIGSRLEPLLKLGTLPNAIFVGRPVSARPESSGTVFKLDPDGSQAIRVKVRYGQASVNTIQIQSGLTVGDRIIVSDTSPFTKYDRIVVQ